MKKVLKDFFMQLGCEKGEDLFEYGFSWFDEVKYLEYILNKCHISRELYEELKEDNAELFQIIDSVDEDNYEKCLSVFAKYLVEECSDADIARVLVSAAD